MDEATRKLADLRIDHEHERKHGAKRRAVPILAALAIGAVVLIWVLTRPPVVGVAEVRTALPGEADTELTASGYVASRRRSIVAPKIPGRLVKVLVREGERVEEGQELARLDDADQRVAVTHARAALSAAEARLARARVSLGQAELELGRTRSLTSSGALSQSVLDQAETTRDAALAERKAATADVATARAAIESAEIRLRDTTVRAPFSGTIVRKLADEGAVLAPAAISELDVGGIVELVDLGALEVEAEVSEDRLSEIDRGQPALIFLDAFPDQAFRGATGTIRPAVDRSKATALVKVEFDRIPDGALPDMSAKVAFLKRALDDADLQREPRLRLPASAVVERDGNPVVFAIHGGRAEPAPVQVAGRVGADLMLDRGPAPGTKVAIAPGGKLRAGQRVRVATGQP